MCLLPRQRQSCSQKKSLRVSLWPEAETDVRTARPAGGGGEECQATPTSEAEPTEPRPLRVLRSHASAEKPPQSEFR